MGGSVSYPHHQKSFKREDLASYARVCSFFNVVLRSHINIETIGYFLTDPLARITFRSFLKKSLSNERADCYIESLTLEFCDHTPSRVNPAVTSQCFLLFLKSRLFSSLYAGMRASITKLAREKDDLHDVLKLYSLSNPLDGSVTCGSESITAKDFQPTPRCSPGSIEVDPSYQVSNVGPDGQIEAIGMNVLVAEDYARAVFQFLDDRDFANIVSTQSWLASFVLASECMNLPIVLVSTGCSRGLPVIYVNPSFERMGQFTKAECIGLRLEAFHETPGLNLCSDNLHTSTDENSSHRRYELCNMDAQSWASDKFHLNEAIRLGREVSIEMPGYTKSGQSFHRQLMTKPIFDQHGRYQYLIGMYFDLNVDLPEEHRNEMNDERDLRSRLRSAHASLVNILPSQLILD